MKNIICLILIIILAGCVPTTSSHKLHKHVLEKHDIVMEYSDNPAITELFKNKVITIKDTKYAFFYKDDYGTEKLPYNKKLGYKVVDAGLGYMDPGGYKDILKSVFLELTKLPLEYCYIRTESPDGSPVEMYENDTRLDLMCLKFDNELYLVTKSKLININPSTKVIVSLTDSGIESEFENVTEEKLIVGETVDKYFKRGLKLYDKIITGQKAVTANFFMNDQEIIEYLDSKVLTNLPVYGSNHQTENDYYLFEKSGIYKIYSKDTYRKKNKVNWSIEECQISVRIYGWDPNYHQKISAFKIHGIKTFAFTRENSPFKQNIIKCNRSSGFDNANIHVSSKPSLVSAIYYNKPVDDFFYNIGAGEGDNKVTENFEILDKKFLESKIYIDSEKALAAFKKLKFNKKQRYIFYDEVWDNMMAGEKTEASKALFGEKGIWDFTFKLLESKGVDRSEIDEIRKESKDKFVSCFERDFGKIKNNLKGRLYLFFLKYSEYTGRKSFRGEIKWEKVKGVNALIKKVDQGGTELEEFQRLVIRTPMGCTSLGARKIEVVLDKLMEKYDLKK